MFDEGLVGDAAQALIDLGIDPARPAGTRRIAGYECAVYRIESPVSGEIVAVNARLGDAPEHVNESPYDDGWLFAVKLSDESELDALLSADDYAKLLEE